MSLTALQIITQAMRLTGAIGQGDEPNADEANEGLATLNRMINGMYGEQIGPRLTPASLTASATGQSGRVYAVALTTATLTLPGDPRPGARVGISDAALALSTKPLTVNRNSRLLEGAASNLTISTIGTTRSWFFRPDTMNWVKETELTLTDSPFFPDRLIAHMPFMLAVYMSAEYADNNLTQVVAAKSQLGYAQFENVYGRHGRHQQNPQPGTNVPGAPAAV